jgi:hypothetical protein
MGRVRPCLLTSSPLGRLATAAILAALAWSARAGAIEDFAKLNDEARAARAAGDIVARERCIERIRGFLNDAPNAVRVAAQVYAEAGDRERMFAALDEFAELGQTDEGLIRGKSPSFARYATDPHYKALVARLTANAGLVLRSELAVEVPDAQLLAEDIDFDAKSQSFLITSVLADKIVRLGLDGKFTDFAHSPSRWPMLAIKLDARHHTVWATEVALNGFTAVPSEAWGRSALLAFDLDSGALRSRIEGPPHAALGDMVLARTGEPIVSDGDGGGVYRLVKNRLERLDAGDFISPQTPVLHPDGKHLIVPDYARGIGVIDLSEKEASARSAVWLGATQHYAMNGIDGMYLKGTTLIAIQNGTAPERVVSFALDPTLTRVLSQQIVERATPELGDPTHGVVVDGYLYYIANAGWDQLDDHGELKPGAALSPARIMRYRIG